MSPVDADPQRRSGGREAALEAVREEREAVERVAESDLPAAWIAQALLEAADADEA